MTTDTTKPPKENPLKKILGLCKASNKIPSQESASQSQPQGQFTSQSKQSGESSPPPYDDAADPPSYGDVRVRDRRERETTDRDVQVRQVLKNTSGLSYPFMNGWNGNEANAYAHQLRSQGMQAQARESQSQDSGMSGIYSRERRARNEARKSRPRDDLDFYP